MKIEIKNGYNGTVIDTKALEINITEAFQGIEFITENGEKLGVSMRDSGFEVHYSGDYGTHGFDAGWLSFNCGEITPHGQPRSTSDEVST